MISNSDTSLVNVYHIENLQIHIDPYQLKFVIPEEAAMNVLAVTATFTLANVQ